MKISIDEKTLKILLKKAGVSEQVVKMEYSKIKLTKDNFDKIEKKLNKDGLVVLKRLQKDLSRFEFVHPKFISIQPRHNFEKSNILKKALITRGCIKDPSIN